MPIELSFRRSAFIAAPPVAGECIKSKSGNAVLCITKATLFRRQGDPASRDSIRLTVERMAKAPVEAVVLPWPIRAKVKPTPETGPAMLPAAAEFHAVVARVSHGVGGKSRKQIKRDNARTLRSRMDDIESPVPKHQRNAVLGPTGEVVTSPKVVSSTWRDPDDSNVRSRTPKLAHGHKPYDPIEYLSRSNPSIGDEHIKAGDCYRQAHDLGPGKSISGGRDLVFSDRQFGSCQGPTDVLMDNMAKWRYVQSKFLPRELQILQVVVLDRTAVNRWAEKIDGNTQKWVGYLVNVLDRLLSVYQDDVDSYLKSERVSFD